jgi:type I restriction enzyme S subunit
MERGLTEASLAEVCCLVTDGTHDTPKRVPSGFPLIKAKEIVSGQINFSSCDQISEADHRKVIARSKPEFGDTLFTHIGASLGAAAFVNTTREFSIKNIALFKPNPAIIDSRYLYYLVVSPDFQSLAIGTKTGSAQPFLGLSQLRSHRIQYHSDLAVQQRIAGILSAYDELIENSQRRIKILELMARALYREWFVNFRFPGHESQPRIASPLGEIPQGWEVKALGDVCSRITDGSHFSPQSVADGYPMASVKDMHDWGINVEGCRRITSDDYENLVRNDCKPLKNDVLIAKDGSYLKHTFVVGEEQDLVILSSIAMLRPNDAIRPNYLCFALRDPVTKARMKGIVSGVAIPRIVLKDFRKFQILVPPDDVQADWARIVDPMLAMCRKLVSQTENLRRTRDLLLPRLLSGQIEVATA